MNILFFDTETTGKADFKAPPGPNQPELVQFAAMLVDDEAGRVLRATSVIVLPAGDIPEETVAIHGITPEMTRKYGVEPHAALLWLWRTLKVTDLVVCHNVDFDMKIMRSEAIRNGHIALDRDLTKIDTFCTMHESAPLVRLPGKYNEFKWPKLSELHKFLFGEDFEGAHDALTDVRATMRCYFGMKERQEDEREEAAE